MKKQFTIYTLPAVFFFLSFILISCGGKIPAVGLEDEIFVIADSSDYLNLEASLYETFSKVIYTPQPENLFDLKRIPLEKMSTVKFMKNLIIAAPLESNSGTSEYIKSILDSAVYDMVLKNDEFVFNKYDLWSKNQLVMILTSQTTEDLNKNILLEQDKLLHYFRKMSDKRLSKKLYSPSLELKKKQAEFLRDYGWVIFVQNDSKVAKNIPEDNFVWLRQGMNTDMEKWIFVNWIDNANSQWLKKDSITSIRDRITSKYYRTPDNSAHVIIAQDQMTSFIEVNFNGKYALMAHGFWRFSDKSGGGPFINYTFYDEETKRIYSIDGSIFAPKYYKKKLIQQVDVTLQSFMTKSELSEERIQDLMDEID